jgi:ATP-binding cassette subfamily B protein IrtB
VLCGVLIELAGVLRMAGNDLRCVAEVLREPSMSEPETSVELERPGAIELDGVDFGYRDNEPVLHDVTFAVPPKSMTALVGSSGSGKTTVTRLIARFWDTDRGVVRVGGVDVRDQRVEDLMAQIAVVFQDVYLFDDTLEANIRLGRPDATGDEVRDAAHLAGVDEIIDRLLDGWSTRVGEAGTRLSGGERQRVSVARALLKDAPIVLLDEATAALDPENERFLQRSLHRLAGRSTVFVIAHHLDTVAAADQIVVLDDGRVAEIGTHEELVSLGGLYSEFWKSRRSGRGWRL